MMVILMKKLTSTIMSGILFLAILIVISPVSADVYNVYESDGWLVLHNTIQNAPSGSTIYVHAGTYYIEDPIDISVNNITIIGDSPFNTIIDATSSGGDGISGPSRSYITIKNITVRNAPQSGIYIPWVYNTVENCIAYNNGTSGSFNGIQVGDLCTVKNCLSYNNTYNGISSILGGTFINCTSANNGYYGFYEQDTHSNATNCIAYNNTHYGFSERVITNYCNSWNNTSGNYEDPQGTGSISADPQFVTGRLGDYYLGYSSPSIDSGSDQSTVLGLYNGFTTRTDEKWDKGTVDMGFHYASNRGPTGSIPILKILEILKKNKN